jgi:RimJ/RimL family protein N-acetyltransferase
MVYKTVRLANDQKAEFDWLKEDELSEVVETLNSVIREGKYLLMNNEITNLEEEHRWFEQGTREGMRYLVVRVDGKVVGGASIHPRTEKSAHVADYGIYLRESYRNLGLGTTLTKGLIKIAKKQGLEILQLSVYSTNDRAFHVYKKCGFRECGRLTRDIKFPDGTYADRILMELPLKGTLQRKR